MADPLVTVFAPLERWAPSDDASTLAALERLGPLPAGARVIDVGCGHGRSSRLLARALGGPVLAVDRDPGALAALDAAARAEGLPVETRVGDLALPDVPDGSVDLLWCEGAAYLLGFDRALATWRRKARPGGRAAVSEVCWLADPALAPAVAREWWAIDHPAMRTVAANVDAAREAGWTVVGTLTLPRSAWAAYYAPVPARIAELRPGADPALAEVLDALEREIAVWHDAGESYGYVFFLLAADDAPPVTPPSPRARG